MVTMANMRRIVIVTIKFVAARIRAAVTETEVTDFKV